MFKNIIKIFKKIVKKLKSTKGNSLAEFAVTTAMMATLATTAAPKFAGIGEAAKEKKTLANIDKILAAANNHYMSTLESEGRGRFPGQTKYNVKVGGVDLGDGQQTADALDEWTKNTLPNLLSIEDDLGTYFVYVFAGSSTDEDALEAYQWAIDKGIAKEQARVVLPEGNTKSRLYMNGTLRSWIHYIQLRAGHGTQKEHIEIAQACALVISKIFPMANSL